jgi:type II secretory pathway component PulF
VICAQLSELLGTGTGWPASLRILARGARSRAAQRLEAAAAECDAGTAPAPAGECAGLWRPVDARLIAAGEASGRTTAVLARLARRDTHDSIWRRRLLARLTGPALLLCAGLVVERLPALFAHELSQREYAISIARALLLSGVSIALLMFATRWLIAPRRCAATAERIRDKLPGRLFLDRLRSRDYVSTLQLALAAGLPDADALELAATTIVHPRAGARAREAAVRVRAGEAFPRVLIESGMLVSYADRETLRIGAATGDPEPLLARRLDAMECDLELAYEYLLDWLPRVAYAAVVTWFLL